MHRIASMTFVALALACTGCQSHETKVDDLRKDYDAKVAKFKTDCSAEYLKIPPTLSPKCADEDKQRTEAWKRLEAERAKK